MDSYIETPFLNLNHHHNHHQQQQNSGLLRFRSAPSSLFNELTQNSSSKIGNNLYESYEKKPEILNSEIGYLSSTKMVDVEQSNINLPPQYPKHNQQVCTSSSMERSNSTEINVSNRQGSCDLNLNRQNSSPAGFFNQLNGQNGYAISSNPRINRLNKSQLPRIPELGNENAKETTITRMNSNSTEYAFVSCNDSSSQISQNGGVPNRSVLSHHLSLPKTSVEMVAVEKLLNFQDVVPCKVRAKRGFATHPRSIAERMRRNRISERMRKLQELVPNMDKQTNTSDMLDLAVDYIKNLQNQYKVLSGNRSKCKCVN